MEISVDSLEYAVLNECKCGFEEFSVLASLVEQAQIDSLVFALEKLTRCDYLECRRTESEPIRLREGELSAYVAQRLAANEDLESYPEVCAEYRFTTTDLGLEKLRAEDRPVSG